MSKLVGEDLKKQDNNLIWPRMEETTLYICLKTEVGKTVVGKKAGRLMSKKG